MGRSPSRPIRRRPRRDRLLQRIRRSRARKPGNPTCVRCGYDLRGLDGLTCPECHTASDPAWYHPPHAAGSQQRLAMVISALCTAWLVSAVLGALVLTLLWMCVDLGVAVACPEIELAGLTLALMLTLVVAGGATARRRRLLWGHKRSVFIVFALLALISLLLAVGAALTSVPSG